MDVMETESQIPLRQKFAEMFVKEERRQREDVTLPAKPSSIFEQTMARAQMVGVPSDIQAALRRLHAKAKGEADARGVLARIEGAIEDMDERVRERRQLATCLLTPRTLVDKFEREGQCRLRVNDEGAIECIGGMPVSLNLMDALHYWREEVRAVLAERQRAVVLVHPPLVT